ncbi:MAG: flagellar protein FliT [Rhodocyclaceae bacterium]|jgi:hypothetical protein|nr:flagellar protein FliT [Rhodocyclaceae bacterium]
MNPTDLLQGMAQLSSQMVEAARNHAWTNLLALQGELVSLQTQLMVLEPEGHQRTPISVAERERKARHARQILDDQAEILSHVQPAQESVRKLLATNALGQTLRKAYSLPGS